LQEPSHQLPAPFQQVLQVIQHQKGGLAAQDHRGLLDGIHLHRAGQSQGVDDRAGNEGGFHQVRQRHEPDGLSEGSAQPPGRLDCQPGLSGSARTGERDQTSARARLVPGEDRFKVSQLRFPSEETGEGEWQVRSGRAEECRTVGRPRDARR